MAPVLSVVTNKVKYRKKFEDARICYSKALLSDRNVGMQSGFILVVLVLLLLFHPPLFFVHYFLPSTAVFAKSARNRLTTKNSSVSDITFLQKT
jgi:hypothetical protein